MPSNNSETLFQLVPRNGDILKSFTSAAAVSNFMWGRNYSAYQLLINGRKYDLPKSPNIAMLNEHLTHCVSIDHAFYFPDETPLDNGTEV
jgi:hypothetical protein